MKGPFSLVHSHNQIAITDFGLSKQNAKLCHTKVGTRYSMAPEVLAQKRPYDPYKADIWGIGVLFFSLLNNCYPFHTRDTENQL